MSIVIPTTEAIKDRNLANLESAMNQTSPLNDKAFLRVLAAVEALMHTELYKYGVERALQTLAISASGADLDRIGNEYSVARKPAEAAVLTIQLPGTNGTVIPATIDYVGDSNKVRYFPESSVTVTGGYATSNVTAEVTGVVGNLQVSDIMTISTQIAGAQTVATVTAIINTGAEAETDDAYRQRILNAIRATAGGGNATDHKIWAETVAGVAQAYPYAGEPSSPAPGIDPSSVPADRTVFVEADTSIDPDGIAPSGLLDEVRAAINNDPVSGASRPPLGLTDSTLHVESITRTEIFIKITNFDPGTGVEVDIKQDIEDALTAYFVSLTMFVVAIDIPADRTDMITKLSIGDIIQDVLSTGDASAELVEFGLATTVPTPLDSYELDEGELVKLGATGGIVYA